MISLGVTKTSPSVQTAQQQVNTISNQITEQIKSLGVDAKDIKTTNYSVHPQYDYTNGSQRVTGYTVNTNIQIKLKPIDKANDAIDLATKAGANQVGGIQFTVDDEKQKELEREARQKAIDDAKQQAADLASAAGINLGRIIDVRESSQNNPGPYPVMMRAELDTAEKEETQLNPGENKITSTVTLSYETF
jgi:uncharacterized protein YggE